VNDVNATAVDVAIIIKKGSRRGGRWVGKVFVFYWIFRRVYSYELIDLYDS
jgi:hypothetical protein